MAILDQLIEKKDIIAYLHFRIEHLELEAQKVRFVVKPQLRNRVYRKLKAKIEELRRVLEVIKSSVKKASKYEYDKVKYLNVKKVEMLRGNINAGRRRV